MKALLDNRIELNLVCDSGVRNIIFCRPIPESLDNVGVFVTQGKEFVGKYELVNGVKIMKCDVYLENKSKYHQVPFEIVFSEQAELPACTFNPQLCNKTHAITEQEKQAFKKILNKPVEEKKIIKKIPLSETTPVLLKTTEKSDHQKIQEAMHMQQALQLQQEKLNQQQLQLKQQQALVEKQNYIAEKIDAYKQQLLHEYLQASQDQAKTLHQKFDVEMQALEKFIAKHLKSAFEDYQVNFEKNSEQDKAKHFQTLLEKINDSIAQNKAQLNQAIEDKILKHNEINAKELQKLSQMLDQEYQEKLLEKIKLLDASSKQELKQSVQEKIDSESKENYKIISTLAESLDKKYADKLIVELEKYKSELFEEFKEISETEIQKNWSASANNLTKKIQLLEDKVKNIVTEKSKSAKDNFTADQNKYINDVAQNWARKILDLGGGSGSVAVQYVNGGTMHGDLNVTGNYLSAGVNLLNVLSGSVTNPYQNLSFNESNANLSISFGNTISLSSLSGTGGGEAQVNALVHANSGQWNTAYTNLVANSAAYLSGFDSSLLAATSGNWNSNYTTTNANSANWSAAYTNLVTNSAAYLLSGTSLDAVATYLSTNNVTMSALTVTQNVSVGGTIYSSASALVIAEHEVLIGNGVNSSFTVNHNLGTDNIQVVVYDASNNIASYPSIQILDNNSISIGFSFVPPSNSYRVVIFGTKPSNQINAYGEIYTFYTTATGFGDIPVLSGNWNSTYNSVLINSGSWNTTYQAVCALSALWSQGGQNAGTASYTVTAQDFIMTGSSSWAVDTLSNTVTGTLPISPSSGMTIRFLDANKTWAVNNFTIVRSGELIESLAENLNCDISGYSFNLTYIGGSIGWRVY